MAANKSDRLLGEILTESGTLSITDLREAANIARNQNLPIGKVLIMSGYISRELLDAAIELQSRLRDDLIDHKSALEIIAVVNKTNCSLDEACTQIGLNLEGDDNSTSKRLAALLVAASLINQTDCDTALLESQRSGLPLGRVLTSLSLLSHEIVDFALSIQKALRAGEISREQAICALAEETEKKPQNTSVNSSDGIRLFDMLLHERRQAGSENAG